MKVQTYVVEYNDGKLFRIKAGSFEHDGYEEIQFFRGDNTGEPDAKIVRDGLISVIPQDMLVSSFEESSALPDVVGGDGDSTDYATETLFSDADKEPFPQPEREAIRAALDVAREKVKEQFQPAPDRQADIDAKIEYLSRKVRELDKFNWKRLLVTTLVGISVDLGFGTLIPVALLNIFKEVLAFLALKLGQKRTKRIAGAGAPEGA
jgi:hypothetical protein